MVDSVKIRRTLIDLDDPCAAVKELRKIRLLIAAGGVPETVRFGDDEVRYSKANLGLLDREIARLEVACEAASNIQPTRRRFAKSFRFV